jgi:hypothetical protein
MNIGSSYSEPLLNKGILSVAPDPEIGIRIGNVIEIAADNDRIGAFVELLTYKISLETAKAKSPF